MMHTVSLLTGESILVQPARPDDAALVYKMYQETSGNSIYQRYLRNYRPSYEEIRQMCSLEPHEGMVLLAFRDKSTVIGYAYYVVEEGNTAEPALLITDKYQGMGLGQQILDLLKTEALGHGVEIFHATLDVANERMLHLIRKLAHPFRSEVSFGVREVFIELAA